MAKPAKSAFLEQLHEKVGELRPLSNSKSLFESADQRVRLYIRYSKLHPGGRTFYGLRNQDLKHLEGHASFIGLIWEGQDEPLLIPFELFEDLFHSIPPAPDGQYKCQVYLRDEGTEFYIAGAGRFNVESHFGWQEFEQAFRLESSPTPLLSHTQVQSLLGTIGARKGFHVWAPKNDRRLISECDYAQFSFADTLPPAYDPVKWVAEQVDIVWIARGDGRIQALFEVEHSTTIYSGLLRLNDVHIVAPTLQSRFSVVATSIRRAQFSRQLNRPTFKASGLSELCSFLEYSEVFQWHQRLCG